MIEPLKQRRRLNDAHARGGKLEREWKTVEAPADADDRGGIRRRKREPLLHLLGALYEECDRRATQQLVRVGRSLHRELERRKRELDLGADLERAAAGRDHV